MAFSVKFYVSLKYMNSIELKRKTTACCVYLRHSLFTVQCVFGPRPVGGAPVEVELSCNVVMRQAGHVHL